MQISLADVRAEFDKLVDHTTTYRKAFFISLEQEKEHLIEETFNNLTDFPQLTQDMLQKQSGEYSSYLADAAPGDWVFGVGEYWVSTSTIEQWMHDNFSILEKSHNRVFDIADYIETKMALTHLKTLQASTNV